MLNQFRAVALQTRLSENAVDGQKVEMEDTEDALDASQYFVEDLVDPWQERDALERERLNQHTQLRELVTRGDVTALKTMLAALGSNAGVVTNMTPGGANTLLYVACEAGSASAASALVSAGADGRAHPVTRYGPLYIACYHGHADIARLLLAHFPEAVQQETVEKWLPLHAACIGGHAALVTLLLEYPYPEHLLQTFTDASGQWRYRFAFDVNARDASGQTALYVACTLGNVAVVDALLAFSLPKERVPRDQPEEAEEASTPLPASAKQVLSPHRAGISLGIHAIVSKLTGSSKPNVSEGEARIRAVRTDMGRGVDSCVAAAVRGAHLRVLKRLLAAGASPDATAQPPHALAYPDPDYKLNKSSMSESVLNARDVDSSLSYSARCPATPVMINWRELRCQLSAIKMNWLRTAALRVNPKLSASGGGALLALTRIELANNELRELPRELFSLISLRYLNAAQNKLERLPTTADPLEEELERSRRVKRPAKASAEVYTAPVLQELYLQDNRLEELPPELFSLPSLTSLDVSNNKLRALPPQMWSAACLRDLNVALNHLRELPASCGHKVQHSSASAVQLSSPSDVSPQLSASPSVNSGQFAFAAQSKSSSRSPSIDGSECSPDDDDEILVIGNRAGNAVWSEARRAHAWRGTLAASPPPRRASAATAWAAALASLNLSHNQFTNVPPPLACLAPALTRLNMAYNSLRSMSYVTSYPTSLRQLDLSHNEITCWPSLPQVESFGSTEGDPLACYCPNSSHNNNNRPRPRSGGSVRSQLLSAACPARRHLRLEGLRTLILANNLLTRIQLTTDDDGLVSTVNDQSHDEDEEWVGFIF
ncbi:unnamed protein product [Parnassius apollo]|uniref:(apollo) hypothetical protein n=1 Tax=Parnassius apollo TaxID=110799 RepID=A0A8S3W2A8_PARAO|nr:unnamed protein product [Parnassius apollo]